MHILSATISSRDTVVVTFDGPADAFDAKTVTFSPPLKVLDSTPSGHTLLLRTEPVPLTRSHTVVVRGVGSAPLIPDGVLNEFYSDKPLGCIPERGRYTFRLFAPRASAVRLFLYRSLDDLEGTAFVLERDTDGVWEVAMPIDEADRYYAYSVDGPHGEGEMFDPRLRIADPYSLAVVTRNDFIHEGRTLLPTHIPPFDWGDDRRVCIPLRDLVVYEVHVRDATAHPSSGVDPARAGTYLGLAAQGVRGGVDSFRSLGVNAVELMPCQHFASIEPPYQRVVGGLFNTWNPYERNHWGYMPSYYFAPEPTYCTGSSLVPGGWNDTGARQVTEFKAMVRALHAAGIAVILDVVYNHTSQYDRQPLKYIDRFSYYRSDLRGQWTNASGCGNDLHTERPMTRRLIIDSVLHWMREYHVDGFRFDLAALIDQETFRQIAEKAREEFPDVILIAEPWGGGSHDMRRFSTLGIASWNDIFRNGVKGVHPVQSPGYAFGTWGWNPPEAFGLWMLGSTEPFGGPLLDAAHSLNYLAAHDGYTLGDFIRIACGQAREHEPVSDPNRHAALDGCALARARMAFFLLLVSQGPIMIQQGDEFGRSKVIAPRRDRHVVAGILDGNSYEKDDETNWIDYGYQDANENLREYVRGLLAVRRRFRQIRHADPSRYRFLKPDVPVASGFLIENGEGDPEDLAVLVNANTENPAHFTIPPGEWRILADGERVSVDGIGIAQGGEVTVPAGTAMLLVRGGAPQDELFYDADTAR
ncbi:MAG: alpha-amylase family glycosyl hydrolase [Bacteroidota bacterium]|nr:alpha-amylase family glycosyl hydrolase [Bacteroidota bacterium]